MKRRKEYMPRTGIRIDRKIQRGAPAGGFIGADIEVFDFTGSVQPSLTERDGTYRVATGAGEFVLTGTTDISDSVGPFGTAFETRLLNASVLGSSVGGLGYANTVVSARTGSIPSWTNQHLGNSAAFIIPTLSSSDHESQVLNARRSGTEPLETTAVPASATMYYSKRSTYNKYVAKKTASFFDTVHRNTAGQGVYSEFVPSAFVAGSGSAFHITSGSTNGTYGLAGGTSTSPAHIYIDVPVSGKLVDIAVWVELHHNSSSLTDGMPLSALAIALKSPGVKPGMSDPALVEPSVKAIFETNDLTSIFTRDAFILWQGGGHVNSDNVVWVNNGIFNPNPALRERVATWDRDFSMRTIFHDGASVDNPRHNVGVTSASGNYNGSPNASLDFNNAWGFGTFWTGSAGSPPTGWLTGPGGVAAVNEWPTTGSNRGALMMRPLYPMLDPIEVVIADPPPGQEFPDSVIQGIEPRPLRLAGVNVTRAGLRGTEISGTWKLLLSADVGDLDYYHPAYFKQVRLELTYEQNDGIALPRNQSNFNARRQGPVPLYEITKVNLVSVTASHVINILNLQDGEIGRTFGVALNTGSIDQSKHALVYRLTGTLADYSGSAPGWLLNNRFGMPAIPLSSASLVDFVAEPVFSIHPQDILAVRPLLDGAQRLSDAARDAKPPRTRADYAADIAEDDEE